MKSENIPVDIKSKSIKEAQNEIKEIIASLENNKTNLEESTVTLNQRLLSNTCLFHLNVFV